MVSSQVINNLNSGYQATYSGYQATHNLYETINYSIHAEFLLHPMPKKSSIPGALEVIKRPYINMFGELDLDNFEAGVSNSKQIIKDIVSRVVNLILNNSLSIF